MWWERSSRIVRRSSCGRSHQAADFRTGIKAARVADGLPRISWRPSKRERSACVMYRSKLVTPLSTQPPIGGCASSSVTSNRGIQARGRPLTASTRRTCQDPTLLPTNHVMSPTPRPVTAGDHITFLQVKAPRYCYSTGRSHYPHGPISLCRFRAVSVTLYTVAPIPEGLVRGGVDDESDCALVPDRDHGFRASRADAALCASQSGPDARRAPECLGDDRSGGEFAKRGDDRRVPERPKCTRGDRARYAAGERLLVGRVR